MKEQVHGSHGDIIENLLKFFEDTILKELETLNGHVSLTTVKRLENLFSSYWSIRKAKDSVENNRKILLEQYEKLLDEFIAAVKDILSIFLRGLEGDLINQFSIERDRVSKFIKTKSNLINDLVQQKLERIIDKLEFK